LQIKNFEIYFINTISALLMLLIYISLILIFFPFGINFSFATQLWKWILALIVLLFLIYVLLIFFIKNSPLNYLENNSLFHLTKVEGFQFKNLFLSLLPMTPVFQYIILNHEMLSLADFFIIMLFFMFLILIFAFVIPWALSIFASRELLMIVALSFLFIIFNMATLSAAFAWHEQGSMNIQLLMFISTTLILLTTNFISKKILFIAVIAFFFINILSSFLSTGNVWRQPHEFEILPLESTLAESRIEKKNDVLLIIYEAYANYETMKHYGFDNSTQLTLLEQNGFHIYHGVYSLGTPTIESMSMLFNIEREPLHRLFLAGDGATHRILSEKGYNTIGVFQNDYNFRGLSIDEITYDFPFPVPAPREGANLLIHAILAGEFSDEVSLKGVGYESYLEQKLKVLNREYPSPKFMYSHSLYPGHRSEISLRPNEDKYIDTYLNRLTNAANIEMLKDIDKIIKLNPNAITIIAGDHGPFLTKTGYGLHLNPKTCTSYNIDRYDMQDRYGAFLAIRWPDENYATRHDIKILQDIFPAVFAYLFDDDSLFNEIRLKQRTTATPQNICGVSIKDGIIVGGKDDGKALFKGFH